MKLKYLPIIVIPILIYLAGAFTAWEFNPGHWDGAGRAFAVVIAVIGSAVTYCLIKESED